MKKLPLVTIFIPTIGRLEYLGIAISSALNQTYPNLEIIVSANAVKYGVDEVLSNFSNSKVKLINRNSRINFITHINLGVAEANGKYFMMLSDDDLISDNYIESLVDIFEADPTVTVGISRQIQLNAADRKSPSNFEAPAEVINGTKFIEDFVMGKGAILPLTLVSLFAPRSLILQKGGFIDFFRGSDGSHADNFLFLSLAASGKIAISSGCLGYRVHIGSTGLKTPLFNLYIASRIYEYSLLRNLRREFGVFTKKYLFIKAYLRKNLFELFLVRYLYSSSIYHKKTSFPLLFFICILHPFCAVYFLVKYCKRAGKIAWEVAKSDSRG
jgi:glycosyltransferase involved in cell wall biosynthesis